jgi:transposase
MLTEINISSEELKELNYERYHYPCPIVQKRFHAIYLKAITGWSNEEIGRLVDSHRNSINKWIAAYKQGGKEALQKVGYGTNTSVMEQEAASITELFTRQPPRTTGEAALKIKELTGIERSYSAVRTFMKGHGFRFLKTGHIPAKANVSEQKKWVEKELKPAINAAHEGKIHLLFLDAAHFVLQPFVCSLWSITRVFIKAAAGRNRVNVLGAINAITKEVSTYINTSYICANSLVDFLKQLKQQYPDKPVAIVLDNARYQHCLLVKTFANCLGFHLLFLSPYSPNLNIIERLWKFTKQKILYAAYYDCPAKFHQAIVSFFDNVNKNYSHELKTLMTLNLQFLDYSIAHSYAA